MKLEDLNITQIRRLITYYNLHNKIKDITKKSKDELIEKLKQHIFIKGDSFYIKQDNYDLQDAIKPKQKINIEIKKYLNKIQKDEKEQKPQREKLTSDLKNILNLKIEKEKEPEKPKQEIKKVVPQNVEVFDDDEENDFDKFQNLIDNASSKINHFPKEQKKETAKKLLDFFIDTYNKNFKNNYYSADIYNEIKTFANTYGLNAIF